MLRQFCFSTVLLLLISSANANLLTNGSFEDGLFSPLARQGTVSVSPGQTNITGWTVINDDLAWIESPHPWLDLTANEGNRFLDLTDFLAGGPFGGVSQTIATIVGESYELSFDLGSSTDWGNARSDITANAGGISQTFSSGQPTGTNEWQTFTLSFSAISNLTTISLIGTSGSDYIGLDNVSVLGANPVPIPAAMWLFGTALIGLVGFSKRSKAA